MLRVVGCKPLRPGRWAPCRPRAKCVWRKAVRMASTFGVNEAKPAYDISSQPWAPLIQSPTTLNVTALNEETLAYYYHVEHNLENRNNLGEWQYLTVEEFRRKRDNPEIRDVLDAFRVLVKVSVANDLLAPQRENVGGMAAAAAKERGADDHTAGAESQKAIAVFDALVDFLRDDGNFEYTLDRHLHMLPERGNAMNQRVLYVGKKDGVEGAEVHNLKRVLVGLAKNGCMLDKNNVWALYHPGGNPSQLKEAHGMTQGVTHGGRISLAWNSDLHAVLREISSTGDEGGDYSETGGVLSEQTLDEKLKMLWYDQPRGYDNPTAREDPLWWSLTVFDPSTIEWGGREVEGGPPVQPDVSTFRAWAENTEMWAALDLLAVPFPSYTADNPGGYERNPVEIKKATDLEPYATSILNAVCSAKRSEERQRASGVLEGYAEYCEEGKVNVKNNGLCTPLNWQSAEEGRIDKAAFEQFAKRAEVFKEEASPKDAWNRLRKKGYIDSDQLRALERTGYIHQPLRVLDDSVRPWTDYRPKGVEADPNRDGYGLFTRPATAVTLTAHFIASNFPPEEFTKGFLKSINKVLDLPEDSQVRQYLVGMAQAQGLPEVNAEAIARMLTCQMLGQVLENMRPLLLEKLRYEKMDEADKRTLDKYLDMFRDLAVDPTLARDDLIVKIKELNDEFREVVFPSLKGNMGRVTALDEIRGLQFYSPLQGVECPKGAPFMPEMVGHHHLAFLVPERHRKQD